MSYITFPLPPVLAEQYQVPLTRNVEAARARAYFNSLKAKAQAQKIYGYSDAGAISSPRQPAGMSGLGYAASAGGNCASSLSDQLNKVDAAIDVSDPRELIRIYTKVNALGLRCGKVLAQRLRALQGRPDPDRKAELWRSLLLRLDGLRKKVEFRLQGQGLSGLGCCGDGMSGLGDRIPLADLEAFERDKANEEAVSYWGPASRGFDSWKKNQHQERVLADARDAASRRDRRAAMERRLSAEERAQLEAAKAQWKAYGKAMSAEDAQRANLLRQLTDVELERLANSSGDPRERDMAAKFLAKRHYYGLYKKLRRQAELDYAAPRPTVDSEGKTYVLQPGVSQRAVALPTFQVPVHPGKGTVMEMQADGLFGIG